MRREGSCPEFFVPAAAGGSVCRLPHHVYAGEPFPAPRLQTISKEILTVSYPASTSDKSTKSNRSGGGFLNAPMRQRP